MSRSYDVKSTSWFPQYRFGVFGHIRNGLNQGALKFVMMQVKPANITQIATLDEFPALQEECLVAWKQKNDPFFSKSGEAKLPFQNMSWNSVPLDDLADELNHKATRDRIVIVCSCTDDAQGETEEIIMRFNQRRGDKLPVISSWATARGYYGPPGTAVGGHSDARGTGPRGGEAGHSRVPATAPRTAGASRPGVPRHDQMMLSRAPNPHDQFGRPPLQGAPRPLAMNACVLRDIELECIWGYIRKCTKEEANQVLRKYGCSTETVPLTLDGLNIDDGEASILAGALPWCKAPGVSLLGNSFGQKGAHNLAFAIFDAADMACLVVDNAKFKWFAEMKPPRCQIIGHVVGRPDGRDGPGRIWSWREQRVVGWNDAGNSPDWNSYVAGLK